MTPMLRFTLPALALGAACVAFSPAYLAADPDPAYQPGSPGKGPLARILTGEKAPQAILDQMAKRLELTDAQKTSLLPILEAARKDLQTTHEGARAILDSTKEKVDAILTPEQRAKAEETRERIGERIRERFEDGQPRLVGGPGAGPLPIVRALRGLDLTDEQTSQVRNLVQGQREKRQAIQKETQTKMEVLDKALKEQIEGLLTTEQKAELAERLQNLPPAPPFGRPDGPDGPEQGFGPGRGGRDGGPRGWFEERMNRGPREDNEDDRRPARRGRFAPPDREDHNDDDRPPRRPGRPAGPPPEGE